MKQRATEGMSAERVGLAVGEITRAIGQPITFTADELAAMPEKAQALIKQRLMAWFDLQSKEYAPKPRIYAVRVISSTPVELPALEPEKTPSKFIGPETRPAMFGTAKAVPARKASKSNPKVEMRNECPRMVVYRPIRVWSK